MPHPRFGRVGKVLCGGGCAQGFPQAIQLKEFEKAGIGDDYIISFSSGAWNSLDPANAEHIWEENFDSSDKIFNLHHDIERAFENILGMIPPPLRKQHPRGRGLWSDWRAYKRSKYKNIFEFTKDMWRLVKTAQELGKQFIASLPEQSRSTEDFSNFYKLLESFLVANKLDKIDSFCELIPLSKTLPNILDLSKPFKRGGTLHILTRSGDIQHIFEVGEQLSQEIMEKISARAVVHKIAETEPNKLFTAAMASSALRPFFPPVKIDDQLFWDAGDANPLPVDYAMDAGCDTIFVFVKNFWLYSYEKELNALDATFESAEVAAMMHCRDIYDRIKERGQKEGKKIYFVCSQQSRHSDLKLLSISPAAVEYTRKIEVEATKRWLKDNLDIEY